MLISARKYFSAILSLFAGLAFVGISGGWKARIAFESVEEASQSDLVRQVVYLLFGLLAAAPFFSKPLERVVRGFQWPLLIVFGWCALSLAWSPVPGIAFKRLVLTVLVSFCCLVLTRQVPPNIAVRSIWRALLVLMVLSVLTVAVAPHLGIHQPDDPEPSIVGAWRGIFYHKNILGLAAAFTAFLSLHEAAVSADRWRKSKALGAWAASLAILYFSGSKTSTAFTLLCSALFGLLYLRRHKSTGTLVALAFAVIVCVVLALLTLPLIGIDIRTALFDPTLFTGRGMIWQLLLEVVREHPIIGVGYQSVFEVAEFSALLGMTNIGFYDTLSHAHNAYLELLVSIGAVGLLLAMFALVVVPARTTMQLSSWFDALRPLLLSCFAFVLMHALLESGLLDRDRPSWLMLLFVYGIALSARDQDARFRSLQRSADAANKGR